MRQGRLLTTIRQDPFPSYIEACAFGTGHCVVHSTSVAVHKTRVHAPYNVAYRPEKAEKLMLVIYKLKRPNAVENR